MNPDVLKQLSPESLAQLFPAFLTERTQGIKLEQVTPLLQDWTLEDYASLQKHLLGMGVEHSVYDSHPACRKMARGYMRYVFPEIEVSGNDFLRRSMQDGPTVIVCNHLSYLDAPATDLALVSAGSTELANKIVYLAGPKVYEEVFRMLAAAAINNLPVPQSTRLNHSEALPIRELARRVRATIDASRNAMHAGRAVLIYPEGSRARDGRLGPFLQATRRYISQAKFLVPAAIVGTDHAMPVDGTVLVPSKLTLTFAPPIALEDLPARQALYQAHEIIEALLPELLRPRSTADRLV